MPLRRGCIAEATTQVQSLPMSREDHRLHAEISALRRQLEQSREPSGMRFSPKEFIVVLTGVLLAIAGVFADDARIVYPCLGLTQK